MELRMKDFFTTKYFYIIPILYFWVLALLPKPVQLLLLIISCLISVRKSLIKIDWFFLLQSIYLGIYLISIIFNLSDGSHDASRVLAAFNTFCITVISLLAYNTSKNDSLKSSTFDKMAFINVGIIIVMALISRFNTPLNNVTIFGKTLVGADWLNGEQAIRFLGFLDYSNLVVFMILLLFPYALNYIKSNRIMEIVLSVLCLFAIYITNSRSGVVLFSVLLLLYLVIGRSDKNVEFIKNNKLLILFTLTVILVFGIAVFHNKIYNSYINMMQLREGSNNMRSSIYAMSWKRMISESPIIGKGIKDYLGNSGYPYGSHSTYLGSFYKAGLVGGIVYIASILTLLIKIFSVKCTNNMDILKKYSIVMILALLFVEDIDGANWSIYISYFMFGLFLSSSGNEVESETIPVNEN